MGGAGPGPNNCLSVCLASRGFTFPKPPRGFAMEAQGPSAILLRVPPPVGQPGHICGPMAAPAVREVRAPAIPFVARPPLATICLPGNAFRVRSPGCNLALAHGTCLAETTRLHARTQAICLFMRMDTNGRKDPACRALKYALCCRSEGVDVFLILQEEEPEMFEHPLPLGDDSS